MTTLAEELSVDIVALIDEFGGAVTITYGPRGQTYDPATGTYSGGTTPTAETPQAIIEDKGLWLGPEEGLKGEKKLTIAADSLTTVPQAGDKFTAASKVFTIMEKGVITTFVGDDPVLYELYGVNS